MSDLGRELQQHLHHAGVRLGGDDEQRFALLVVDVVVGCARHGEAQLGHVCLRDPVLAVIDADVAIDVEEAEHATALGHAALGEFTAESLGTAPVRQQLELLAQRLHLGCPVEAQQPAEIGRGMFLERLGPLDAQQSEQHQGHDCRAQAVERRRKGALAVDRTRSLDDPARNDAGNGEQHAGAGHARRCCEDRRRIVEQAEAREMPVAGAIERVDRRARRNCGSIDRPRGW